jgi:UDP-N-acetylmuramoylalanine--D-glutamate ligase
VSGFSGLEHRLELVRDFGGVKWVNDSFSTTPETAMAAINAFSEPKILILGGSDQKSNYSQMAELVAKSNVRYTLLVGQTASELEDELRKAGYDKIVRSPGGMSEIVTTARTLAHKSDVVILSPASGSFDLFKNYKDRGQQFKTAVGSIR